MRVLFYWGLKYFTALVRSYRKPTEVIMTISLSQVSNEAKGDNQAESGDV